MSKIVNITDKLNNDKPQIKIGEEYYQVNDGMETVIKFEELIADSSVEKLTKAVEISLGDEAAKKLKVRTWSIGNFKVLTIAILAAMQGIDYEEAEARFRKSEQQG